MSNLIKALKRAERDRQAALQGEAPLQGAQGAQEALPLESASPAEEADLTPAVARSQREDAARGAHHVAPAAPLVPTPNYRGLVISLVLAVALAAAVGWWVRGMAPPRPAATGVASTPAATPPAAVAARTLPAALRAPDATPLELRLDRGVDAVGKFMHQRGKAQ